MVTGVAFASDKNRSTGTDCSELEQLAGACLGWLCSRGQRGVSGREEEERALT